jgi:hypothetical protein
MKYGVRDCSSAKSGITSETKPGGICSGVKLRFSISHNRQEIVVFDMLAQMIFRAVLSAFINHVESRQRQLSPYDSQAAIRSL